MFFSHTNEGIACPVNAGSMGEFWIGTMLFLALPVAQKAADVARKFAGPHKSTGGKK